MPTPKLSDASEKRIITALEAASGLMEDGTHPTDAIYKVAKDMRMPAGHIQLMVNAVNTGKTNEHRLSADDLFKKAEEFPLADAHAILSRLYPDTIKTAAAVRRESEVSEVYKRPPRLEGLQKQAAAPPLPALPKPAPYPTDPNIPYEQAAVLMKKAEVARDEARLDAARLHDQCVKLAGDLMTYFRRPGCLPFGEVAYNANELFGTRGQSLMTMLADRLPTSITKRAAITMHAARMDKAPYSLIRQVLEVSRDYFTKKSDYQSALAEVARTARESLLPFVCRPNTGRSVLADLSLPTDDLGREKDAGFFSALGGGVGAYGGQRLAQGVMQKMPGYTPDQQKRESEYLTKLLDPSHEIDIRNIQAEAMLNNLMANDEVISTHHPQDVLDAYNEVSQMAPHASTQTALMRDLIRKRLSGGAGALDTFTLDSLVGTNNKLKQRDDANAPNLNVLQAYGVIPNAQSGAAKSASVLADG